MLEQKLLNAKIKKISGQWKSAQNKNVKNLLTRILCTEVFSTLFAGQRKFAFTLAEVLITLGIIGVVAAMTLPGIVAKYKEKVLVERLKQTYSIFSQAFLRAVEDNGPPDSWELGESATMDGAVKLYNIFKPYLLEGKDCGREYGCFSDSYKTLSGQTYRFSPRNHTMYARGILINGSAFAFTSHGNGCSYELGSPYQTTGCGILYVDLNGYQRPNQAGIDYFGFFISKNGILPVGLSGWNGGTNGYTCQYQGTTGGNGTGCTAWVLYKNNMDYSRRDISSEW